MIEIILFIVFVISLVGMGVILYRKIPMLITLPEDKTKIKFKWPSISLPFFGKLNYELYLQKILSKVRVLTLKTENKTSSWLEKLRQKNNQKNNHQPDNYWEELKKSKDKNFQ